MKLKHILMLLAAGGLVSCSTDGPYCPVAQPEQIEFSKDHRDIYPEDVRKDSALYTHWPVAWAGIIVRNDVTKGDVSGKIRMDTVFEHHYYDWGQVAQGMGVQPLISHRSEGRFRMRWLLTRNDADASDSDVLKYAAPGKLAIVYATPESVDADGTIVMRYHYIRVLGPAQFTPVGQDYGRLGKPFQPGDAMPKAAATVPSH
jgi:hypothetical protein